MRFSVVMAGWILILCCLVSAAGIRSGQQENDEKDQAIKKAVKEAFPDYSLSSVTGISSKLLLFKSNLLSISFNNRDSYSSLQIDLSRLIDIPKLNFSFFINDPYSTCPALENIVLPRTSLNIDPIIGKYYWEW